MSSAGAMYSTRLYMFLVSAIRPRLTDRRSHSVLLNAWPVPGNYTMIPFLTQMQFMPRNMVKDRCSHRSEQNIVQPSLYKRYHNKRKIAWLARYTITCAHWLKRLRRACRYEEAKTVMDMIRPTGLQCVENPHRGINSPVVGSVHRRPRTSDTQGFYIGTDPSSRLGMNGT